MNKGRMKKWVSALLCLAMLLQNAPVMAFAATTDDLCDHHSEHTADCGYVEAVAGSPCTHSHDGICGYAEAVEEVPCACAQTDETGALVHTEGCGYVAPVAGADCAHVHDDACGYVQALTGSPCAYRCEICLGEDQEEPSEEPSEEASEEPAEPREPVTVTETVTQRVAPETDLPENDEIFALYVENKLYGYEMVTFGTQARAGLNAVEQAIYDALKAKIENVAANGGGTAFALSNVEGLKTSWENTDSEAVKAAFKAQFSQANIVSALLADCPFDLYWYDKTTGVQQTYSISTTTDSDGNSTTTISDLTFTFAVSGAYKSAENTVTENVTGVTTAKANAAKVVADNAGKAPYERLKAYKDYICGATSYNTQAAADDYNGGYGDPWQLIYVFDGDPGTTVVCEGYAKAFQYLCDLDAALSEEDEDDVICVQAEGNMSGGTGSGEHMWNVVTLEGKNYLVDVTNCDEGTVGAPDGLFLVGGTYADGGYSYTIGNQTVTYTACGDLNLSAEDYTEPTQTITTLYFDNSVMKWESVNAYFSDASNNTVSSQWPGTAMTCVEGDIYSIAVPAGAANVVFNNGINQSADLTLGTVNCYKLNRANLNDGIWYTYPCEHDYQNNVCTICGVQTYSLWIANEEVTSNQLSGEGWSYDPETQTLTLNNYDNNGACREQNGYSAVIWVDKPVTIQLVGENTVANRNAANHDGIYVAEKLTITGDGTLNVTGHPVGIYVANPDLNAKSRLEITGGTINATGDTYGILGNYTSAIEITGGVVNCTGGFEGINPSESGHDGYFEKENGDKDITIKGAAYEIERAEGLKKSTVTFRNADGYTIQGALEGETVTMIVTPDEGYKLSELTVTFGEEAVAVTDNTFTMPAGDVTVAAAFAICGHENKTYAPNDDGTTHRVTCGDCGMVQTAEEAHTGGTATCQKQAVCELCGTAYGEKNSDNHAYDPDTGKCPCGAQAVASVTLSGTVQYFTAMQDALNVAKAGTETAPAQVKLLTDCDGAVLADGTESEDMLSIESGVMTIDLNGHTLTHSKNSSVLALRDETPVVTITDSSTGKTGCIDGGEAENGTGTKAVRVAAGTLILQGGTYKGSTAIVLYDQGQLKAENAVIHGISLTVNATATVQGGTIHDSRPFKVNDSATLTVTGAPELTCDEGEPMNMYYGGTIDLSGCTGCAGWRIWALVDMTVGEDLKLPEGYALYLNGDATAPLEKLSRGDYDEHGIILDHVHSDEDGDGNHLCDREGCTVTATAHSYDGVGKCSECGITATLLLTYENDTTAYGNDLSAVFEEDGKDDAVVSVKLLADLTLEQDLDVLYNNEKTLTLDLNGKTLDAGINGLMNHGTLTITGSGRLTGAFPVWNYRNLTLSGDITVHGDLGAVENYGALTVADAVKLTAGTGLTVAQKEALGEDAAVFENDKPACIALEGTVDLSGSTACDGWTIYNSYADWDDETEEYVYSPLPVTNITLPDGKFLVDSNGNAITGETIPAQAVVTIGHTHVTENDENKATCTTQAICDICGSEYGETLTHDMDPTDGECKYECGKLMAEASATVGNTTTYHETLDAAIQAVNGCTEADNAIVQLLESQTLRYVASINSGVFTLDLNSKTLECNDFVLEVGGSADVTIRKGTINCTNMYLPAVNAYGGTVTLEDCSITGGNFGVYVDADCIATIRNSTVTGNSENGVVIHSATVTIENSTIEGKEIGVVGYAGIVTISGGSVTGGTFDLYGDAIKLTLNAEGEGTTFPGGIYVGNCNLENLIADDLAYWQGGKMVTLTIGQEEISGGDVTVKAACDHSGNTNKPTDAGNGQHSFTCSVCENTVTGDHTGGEATCTEQAKCDICGEGYGELAAHTLTYTAQGSTITESCSANCGYTEIATIRAENTTYNGMAQETATVDYSEGWSGGELTIAYDKNVNAGTATASITLGEGENAATASVKFTIARKKLTPIVEGSVSKTYDGTTAVPASNNLSIMLDGIILGDSISATASYAYDGADAGTTKIDATGITLGGEDAGNYQLTTNTAKAEVGTIKAKNISGAEITLGTAPTYNGEEQTQTVSSVKIDELTVTYTVSGNTGTNAGNYTLTVTGTGNFEGTAAAEWSIAKAEPQIVWSSGDSNTYGKNMYITAYINGVDGNLLPGTAIATVYDAEDAELNSVTCTKADSTGTYFYNWLNVLSDGTYLTPGSYVVKLTYQGNENYNAKTVELVTYTISKADPVIGTVGCNMALFDSTDISTVNLTRTDMSVDGTLILTDSELTAGEGTYNWKFTPEDTDNYNTITGTVTLNVSADELEQIRPTGTLEKFSYVYGESFSIAGMTVTAEYTSGATKDVTGLVSFDSTLAVGQTAVELTYHGKICVIDGITVAKKQLIISGMAWDVPENAVYNGTAYTATLTGDLPEGVTVIKTGDTATNAGGYTAKAVFSLAEGYSADNYEIVNGADLTAAWSIDKAPSTITKAPEAISGLKFIEENGQEVQQNLITAGEATGGTMVYRLSSDDEWSERIPTAGQVRDYTVYYKVLGDSNHNDSAEGQVNVSIAKADAPTVTIPVQKHFYTIPTTGNRIDIKSLLPNLCAIITDQSSVTGTTGDFITNAVLKDGILTYDTDTASAPVSGTITVKIVMRNYEDITVTVDVALIALNPVSNSGTDDKITYDGSKYDVAQMFIKDTNAGEASYAITGGTGAGELNGSELTITKAGTIQIKMTTAANGTYAEGEATATLTVEKGKPTITVSIEGWTYGEEPNDPVSNGPGEVTYTYDDAIRSYDSTVPPTDAGDWVVLATYTGDDLYHDGYAFEWFTIAKKALTIKAEDHAITYGDAPAANGVTGTGFVTGESQTDLSGTLTYSFDYERYGDVGDYAITPGGLTSGNYEITYQPGTLTVTPKAIDQTDVALQGTLTYNGEKQSQAITVKEGVTVSVSGNEATEAGQYTMTVTGTGNYTGEVKLAYTVAKKNVSLVWENTELVYNGTAQSPRVTLTGIVTGDDVQAVVSGTGTNVGTYTATVSLSGADAGNYTLTGTTSRAFTIVKANVTITPEDKVIYMGEQLPVLTYTVSGLASGESLTREPDLTTNAQVDKAGSYTITAANAQAGDNYQITYADGTLTIMDQNTEVKTRILQTALTKVPEGLKNTSYNTVEAIRQSLASRILATSTGFTRENMAHYDVVLQFSLDGGKTWIQATEESFPTEGITVTLPYPEGTDAKGYDFAVSHMFTVTSQRLGTTAGDVELPRVTETAEGLRVTLKGMSPVTVAWSAVEFDVTIENSKHGTVTTDVTKAVSGQQVAITVTPKYGYKMATLTVKDADGKSCALRTDNNGRYYFTMPSGDVTVQATFNKITTYTPDSTNPKTGDTSGVMLYSAVMFMSLAAMAAMLSDRKRRQAKK